MRWAIIGGDAAGMSGACRARRHDPALEVVVLAFSHYGEDVASSVRYLPDSIGSAGREIDDLVVCDARTFRDHLGIDSRAGHWVAGIDRNAGKVVGTRRDGVPFTVGYDRLRRLVGPRQFPGARSTSPDERLFHGNEVIFPAA